MSQTFDLEDFVDLCRGIHEENRQSVARTIDRSLVVRNWLLYFFYGHIRTENPAQEKSATLLRILGDQAISATASRKLPVPVMGLPRIPQTLSVEFQPKSIQRALRYWGGGGDE